jgi:glutathione S-transferase
MEKLTLYDYAASANCYKVRLLLAQLGREYRRVPVDIFAGETLTDAFATMNPARTTPVLAVGDSAFLPESGAIMLYLAEGSELLPADALARAQVARWLLYEQADVVPAIGGLRFRLVTGRLAAGDPRAVARRRAAGEVLALLDGHLAANDFLVDRRYSVADIGMYGYVHVAPDAGIDLAPFAAVRAWLARVAAQPGHVADLEPYPANAAPGAGRSTYD